MEVCVCKLTGAEHFCCRDGSSMGCELSVPNDDGFFVCPVTGKLMHASPKGASNDCLALPSSRNMPDSKCEVG